jgi:hypothetical protein
MQPLVAPDRASLEPSPASQQLQATAVLGMLGISGLIPPRILFFLASHGLLFRKGPSSNQPESTVPFIWTRDVMRWAVLLCFCTVYLVCPSRMASEREVLQAAHWPGLACKPCLRGALQSQKGGHGSASQAGDTLSWIS